MATGPRLFLRDHSIHHFALVIRDRAHRPRRRAGEGSPIAVERIVVRIDGAELRGRWQSSRSFGDVYTIVSIPRVPIELIVRRSKIHPGNDRGAGRHSGWPLCRYLRTVR